jgi:polyisoprenoid-binding protein YceI
MSAAVGLTSPRNLLILQQNGDFRVGTTVALLGRGEITMTRHLATPVVTSAVIAALITIAPHIASAQSAPLTLSSATVSIAGTSNIHEFTASTKDVRVTRLAIASGVAATAVLDNPAAVEAFEIVVRAASLTSPKDGLDKNMHKALKVTEFPEIVFRLNKLEGKGAALKAIGTLKIAGVEKPIAFDAKAIASPTTLTITGEVPLLMPDYGIAPPKAMMGMLKTDPKIVVKFETVFSVPTTF